MKGFEFETTQDTVEERLIAGVFRCALCQTLRPQPPIIQNGAFLCRRCAEEDGGVSAVQIRFARERAANASAKMEMSRYPVTSCFAGAPTVISIVPQTLNLTRGGAAGSIAITGLNLSSADVWTASNVNITPTPTVNSTSSVTLSIAALVGTPRANYSLLFNGDTLTPRGILKVR